MARWVAIVVNTKEHLYQKFVLSCHGVYGRIILAHTPMQAQAIPFDGCLDLSLSTILWHPELSQGMKYSLRFRYPPPLGKKTFYKKTVIKEPMIQTTVRI